MRYGWRIALSSVGGAMLAACATLVGDFELTGSGGGTASGATGSGGATTSSSSGASTSSASSSSSGGGIPGTCASPIVLADPSTVQANNAGQPAQTASPSCASATTSGPEIVYAITAAHDGVLAATLTTAAFLRLYARATCADPASDRGCVSSALTLPVKQGDTVFLFVDGAVDGSMGPFTLHVESRPLACGDGHRDLNEQCDPPDDAGCGAACAFAAGAFDESEPNDLFAEADPYVAGGFNGAIDGAADEDCVSFHLPSAAASISARVVDLGASLCAVNPVYVRLLDASQTTFAEELGCSAATLAPGPAGDYLVRVGAYQSAASFPYRLQIDVTP